MDPEGGHWTKTGSPGKWQHPVKQQQLCSWRSHPGILRCDGSPGSGAGEVPLSAGGFPGALEQIQGAWAQPGVACLG